MSPSLSLNRLNSIAGVSVQGFVINDLRLLRARSLAGGHGAWTL